jgi:SAM-dependent methyltransferase
MDLSEVRASSGQRHPWETARAEAIERILRARAIAPDSVLDVGCGDGFTGEHLLKTLGARTLWGVDVYLTPEDCEARSRASARYVRELSQVTEHDFELALLCDVIEHVEDDKALVASILSRLAPTGHLLITVPSFQALFSSHDRALKHYRRYSLPELRSAVELSGGELLADGYLFGSLLPVRLLQKAKESLLPRSEAEAEFGVGGWSAPALVTKALHTAFRLDNGVMLALNAAHIKAPGLSAWALCKKRT